MEGNEGTETFASKSNLCVNALALDRKVEQAAQKKSDALQKIPIGETQEKDGMRKEVKRDPSSSGRKKAFRDTKPKIGTRRAGWGHFIAMLPQ